MKVFVGCQHVFHEWAMVYSGNCELTHNILSTAFKERVEWSKTGGNTHLVHIETMHLLTELLHVAGVNVDVIPSEGWSPMAFILHCEGVLEEEGE